jgi:hypothetical protein
MTDKFWLKQKMHGVKDRNGHMVLGCTLVGVGIVWMATNAGWIPALDGPALFWPTVMIALGVFMAVFANHRRKRDKYSHHAVEKATDTGLPQE